MFQDLQTPQDITYTIQELKNATSDFNDLTLNKLAEFVASKNGDRSIYVSRKDIIHLVSRLNSTNIDIQENQKIANENYNFIVQYNQNVIDEWKSKVSGLTLALAEVNHD